MIKAIIRHIRKEKGAALSAVMLIMVLGMVIITVVMSLYYGNLKMAKRQQLRSEAYYLALSGIDMGVAALMKADADENRLLDTFVWDPDTNPDMVDDLASKPVLSDELDFGGDKVYVTISAQNNEDVREVKIHSLAVISGTDVKNELTLVMAVDNPKDRRWE